MILERDAPSERDRLGIGVAAERAEPRRERFEMARQQAVVRELAQLLARAGGGAARQQRGVQAGAQLAAMLRQRRRRLGKCARNEIRQRPDFDVDALEVLRAHDFERLRQRGRRSLVIAAVHEEQRRDVGTLRERRRLASDPRRERRGLGGKTHRIPVAMHQEHDRELRAVRAFPREERAIDIGADTAPQHGGGKAEAREELRQLSDVAELVGHVADAHRAAERLRLRESEPQIADQRLARHQPFVWQHMPGSDREPSGAHQFLDSRARMRAHFEVVVDGDGLPIEHEMAERGIALEQIEHFIDQRDEAHTELFVRAIPLAIPMRVRNDDDAKRLRIHRAILTTDLSAAREIRRSQAQDRLDADRSGGRCIASRDPLPRLKLPC